MPIMTFDINNTTFVSSAQPDSNMSNYRQLYSGTDLRFLTCISLMQIKLPSLPFNQVEKAIIQLAVIIKSGETASPIFVSQIAKPFNFLTVTYRTCPPLVLTTTEVEILPRNLYTTVNINITELVNSWLNDTLPNNGIALTNSDGSTVVQFAAGNDLYVPKLILTYSS